MKTLIRIVTKPASVRANSTSEEVRAFIQDYNRVAHKITAQAGEGSFSRALSTSEASAIVDLLKNKGLPVSGDSALKLSEAEISSIVGSKRLNGKTSSGAKEYTCQFWQPGVVSYEDCGEGVALLNKETMDKMLPSFVGKPVVIDHVEAQPEEIFNSGQAVGRVTEAVWNAETGWYDAKFTVEDPKAQELIESGYSVSCAFNVMDAGEGGEWHSIKYNEEVTDGSFTHLALVENPRYEDSKIFKNHKMRLNAKGVKMNKKYAVGDRVEYRGEIGTVAGYSGHIVVVDYDAGGTARVSEDNDDLKKKGDMTAFKVSKENAQYKVGDAIPAGKFFKEGGTVTKVEGNKFWITFTDGTNKKEIGPLNADQFNSKDNAKTVLISIPYRLLEHDDDKNPDQELQTKGLRNVGGGGGVADFEFNGTESQAAAIVKQVLGTVSGVDIGMMNSKENGVFSDVNVDLLDAYEKRTLEDMMKRGMTKEQAIQIIINNVEGDKSQLSPQLRKFVTNAKENSDASNKQYDALLKEIQSIHVMTKEKAEAMLAKIDAANLLSASEKDSLEYNLGKQRARSHGKENSSKRACPTCKKFTAVWEDNTDGDKVKCQECGEPYTKENANEPAAGNKPYCDACDRAKQKKNDAWGANTIRVTFRTKRGSTDPKYVETEEFSSEANAKLRASALNWDIISIEPIAKSNDKKNNGILRVSKKNCSDTNAGKSKMFGWFKSKKNAVEDEAKKKAQDEAALKAQEAAKDMKENGEQVNLAEQFVDVDGEQVSLADLITTYKAEQAEQAVMAENAAVEEKVLSPEDPIADETGNVYKVGDLLNAYHNNKARMNAEAEEKAKKESEEKAAKENATETPEEKAAREAKENETPEEKELRIKKENEKESYLNGLDFGDGKTEADARAKLKEMGYTDAEVEEAISTKKAGASKTNSKGAKKDIRFFKKLNSLKESSNEIMEHSLDTLKDKIARGKQKYGSKKKK